MYILDAIKLIFQKLKDSSARIQRIEKAMGKYITDGALAPEAIPYEKETINFDEVVFIDNEEHASKLKSEISIKNSVVWDEANGCWHLYAVYAD